MPQHYAETSLYPAVKAHLERLGYEVEGEICSCDIVAVRPSEPPWLVVTELKTGFTLELVLQAADRFAAADEVWLAVTSSQRGRDRDRRVHKLCRLLGFGLLAVDSMPPCRMARGCGRMAPYPDLGLCGADVLRASELEHAVQHVDGDGNLGLMTPVGLRE
jgi:hypothetical protein